jgi:transcriptional regulator with XRE-family HTH domain
MFMRDGKFYANDKEYDSWDAAEADIPNWIKAEEDKRGRKLEPAGSEEEIKIQDILLPRFEDGPSDYVRFGPEPDDADYRAGFFDKDGNRLPGPPAGDDPRPALTEEQKKKLDAEIRDLIENPPAPTELDKRIEKFLKETREEWDNAQKDYARIQGEVGDFSSPEDLPMEGVIEGTNIRYEIKTGPGQLGGRMRDGRIRNRARAEIEGQIAGLYLTGDTSGLELPELERNGIWRGQDGGDRSVIFQRPTAPHPFAGDPVEDAKKIVAQLNEQNRGSGVNTPPTPPTGKEIYERRIATGDSLDKVAKDLGIPREEVRRLEAEYGRTLDGGAPGEPTTPPTGGGSSTPGSSFSDYVIDLASGNRSPANDLQEQLDEDAERLAVDFIENIYEDASDEFDLAETIKDDKPEGMSDKEFIDGAAAQMRENLEAIVDRAIEDRNDFVESGDAEPVDFDREAFINAAIERYKELVQEELDGIREEEGDDEPPTPPSGGTPPKTPSPSTPSAPGLFSEFEAPNGAFKLRTAD